MSVCGLDLSRYIMFFTRTQLYVACSRTIQFVCIGERWDNQKYCTLCCSGGYIKFFKCSSVLKNNDPLQTNHGTFPVINCHKLSLFVIQCSLNIQEDLFNYYQYILLHIYIYNKLYILIIPYNYKNISHQRSI
jgi:hypothetical protein